MRIDCIPPVFATALWRCSSFLLESHIYLLLWLLFAAVLIPAVLCIFDGAIMERLMYIALRRLGNALVSALALIFVSFRNGGF